MNKDDVVRGGFPSSFWGWRKSSVRKHLEAVADEMERLRERPDDQAVQEAPAIAELEREGLRLQAQEKAFAITIAAQARADETLTEARGKSAEILHEAHEKAEGILREADARRLEVDREFARSMSKAEQAVDAFVANAFAIGERLPRFGHELARGFELDPSLPALTKRRFASANNKASSPGAVIHAPSVHG